MSLLHAVVARVCCGASACDTLLLLCCQCNRGQAGGAGKQGVPILMSMLRATVVSIMCIAGFGLLSVISADYWVASDVPLPTHALIRRVAGPLLEARRQRWHTEAAPSLNREVSAVLAALAAAVLVLCSKQRCWILCRSQPQPSLLVVTLGWLIVIVHSGKYARDLLLTSLSQATPWMAVHHAVAICILTSAVWEPKCISFALVLPYFLHELSGARGATLTNMNTVARISAYVYNVLMFVLLGWHMHCGVVQRASSKRVGMLVGVLMATNYASYCTEISNTYCIAQYDSNLDAFYALAEGQRPWLMKMWAGVVAFVTAAVVLTCVFALVCVVVDYLQKWTLCERCGRHRVVLQCVCLRAKCCGAHVAKVPSKVH